MTFLVKDTPPPLRSFLDQIRAERAAIAAGTYIKPAAG